MANNGWTDVFIGSSTFTGFDKAIRGNGRFNLTVEGNSFVSTNTAMDLAGELHLDGLLTNSYWSLVTVANLTGRIDLRAENASVAGVDVLIRLIEVPGGTLSINGSNVFLRNVTAADMETLLVVSTPIGLAPSPPVNVTLVDISMSGGAATILNYTGPGSPSLVLSRIQADGNGSAPGIWIRYGYRMNLSVSDIQLTNHSTGVYVDRAVASLQRDRWILNNVTISKAINGVALVTAHVIDADFQLTECLLNASASTVFLVGVAGEISGCELHSGGSSLDVHDSQVILQNTLHDTFSIITDFRLGAGFLEAWANYSFSFRWGVTGAVPTGWRAQLEAKEGGPLLDAVLDSEGRPFPGTRYGLIYRIVQNLSNWDARTILGNLSIPGRAANPVLFYLTGNMTNIIVEVEDRVPPALVLSQLKDGEVFLNSATAPLQVSLYDPETGLLGFEIDFYGVQTVPYNATGGPVWLNVSVPLSLPYTSLYLVTFRAWDIGGTEVRVEFNLTVDVVSPTPALLSPANGSALNTTDITMRFASDADTVALTVDGVAAAKMPEFSGDRPWGISLSLAEGVHILVVEATDHVGNRGVLLVHLVVDLTPPSPAIDGIFDGMEVNATPVAFSVRGEPTDTVVLDGVPQSGSQGTFDLLLSLPTGPSTHTLTVTDRAGNQATFTYRIVLDVWPPTATFEAPFSGGGVHYVNSSSIEIPVRTSADVASVEIAGVRVAPDASHVARVAITLSEGTHELGVVVTDRAGNRATFPLTVVVDLSLPFLVSSNPASGSFVRSRTVFVQFTLSEEGTVRWGSGQPTAVTTNPGLSLPMEEREVAFLIHIVDRAGNGNTTALVLRGDFTAPFLEVTSPANRSTTSADHATIKGGIEPGSRLFVGGVPFEVSADGSFSVDAPLKMGDNTFVVVARDEAGNEATVLLDVRRESPAAETSIVVVLGVAAAIALSALVFVRKRRSPPDRSNPPETSRQAPRPPRSPR